MDSSNRFPNLCCIGNVKQLLSAFNACIYLEVACPFLPSPTDFPEHIKSYEYLFSIMTQPLDFRMDADNEKNVRDVKTTVIKYTLEVHLIKMFTVEAQRLILHLPHFTQ